MTSGLFQDIYEYIEFIETPNKCFQLYHFIIQSLDLTTKNLLNGNVISPDSLLIEVVKTLISQYPNYMHLKE